MLILVTVVVIALFTVQGVLFPSEVLAHLQVPAWLFWIALLGLMTWCLGD